jgi:hypothetical protein
MSVSLAEFIVHRVEALAYVYLTRRNDLVVMKHDDPEEGELDLLVRINVPGPKQFRYFGVILKGTSKFLSTEDASRELNTYFRQNAKQRGAIQYPFPVIALIFSMENDEGFYAWRNEPQVLDGTHPILKMHPSVSCEKFSKPALDQVVNQSIEWYDSFYSFITPE